LINIGNFRIVVFAHVESNLHFVIWLDQFQKQIEISQFKIIQFKFIPTPFLALGREVLILWVVETSGKGGSFSINPESALPLTSRPEYENQPSCYQMIQLVLLSADGIGNLRSSFYIIFEAKKSPKSDEDFDR